MTLSRIRIGIGVVLAVALVAGLGVVSRSLWLSTRTTVVGYFENSNGLFNGDEVRILGVPVGVIERIEPQPQRAKITFSFDRKHKVPADAKAVIISPQLVTARAIQLTPAYTGGPVMADGAVIPQERTAVPVEWDDLREQLEKLTETLQPTEAGGVSTLGAFIDTTAANLRGEGASIRETIVELSEAMSALDDHSTDVFGTVKNLSILVSALRSSADLMKQLNRNLASASALLANDPNEVGQAIDDLNTAVGDVRSFVADTRGAVGTSSAELSSISQALVDSLDDVKQALHVAPNTMQNLANIYQPAQAALTGALAMNNFANPITFLCGAIQAASRRGAEESAKLCVQYLAPIVKNRQYNFLPFGMNFFVGAQARPNEITFSEDWMRPDHVPSPESTLIADPAAGLPGLMLPEVGGA